MESAGDQEVVSLVAQDEMRPRVRQQQQQQQQLDKNAVHVASALPPPNHEASSPSKQLRHSRGLLAAVSFRRALIAAACVGGAALVVSSYSKHSESHLDHVLPHELSYLHHAWHPRSRSDRFPSVDERTRLYMSNWYVPPCAYSPRTADVANARASASASAAAMEPSHKDRIWYRYNYPDLATWAQRPNFLPNMTVNFVADVYLDGPMHYAAGDSCHRVTLSTDVETGSPKDYELHNLYVLDRDLVAKCSDTPPRQNHHAPYCRDSLEMLDIMDALDGAQPLVSEESRRSGDLSVYSRSGLRLKKQLAYGYDMKEQQLKLDVEAMTNKKTGHISNVINTRTPVIVRFGDTLGVWCDLPIIGKTRISAAPPSTGALHSAIASASADPFLGVQPRSVVPPPPAISKSEPLAVACHPLHLHIPRLPLQTVDRSFENFSPIVWDFHSSRSNAMLQEVLADDIPWRKKKEIAYWRGALTGSREKFDRHVMTDEEVCNRIPRCRLVMLHDKSKMVDARLTHSIDVPMENFGDVRLFTRRNKKITYKDQLKAKALIVMEGNDLATGLRWSLLSRSVVMMPPPTRTSWAMEEFLQPWVHYIPLNANLTNVEEMVQWMRDNDQKAHRIAERGTLFAYDLVLHPNSKKDDLAVKQEMLRRYRQYFSPDNRYNH